MMFAGDGGGMENSSEGREFGSWLETHRDLLLEGTLALDLGCGLGDDARYLVDAGLRVVGMDLSVQRIAQAAQRAQGASFVVANLADGLPFRSDCAGVVTASLSLHYFDRRTTARIVHDIARVLQPGGILLCRVNVVGETQSLWGEGVEHEPDFFEVEPGRFKRFFSEDTLTEMLQQCLSVESMWREETRLLDEHHKATLVAQARRRT
jgi:ubiquinone/menaquinone biosynthesis C-methylase UbiE